MIFSVVLSLNIDCPFIVGVGNNIISLIFDKFVGKKNDVPLSKKVDVEDAWYLISVVMSLSIGEFNSSITSPVTVVGFGILLLITPIIYHLLYKYHIYFLWTWTIC